MDPRLEWAFKQSIRQLIRLGAKFDKWKAETTIKIPELMQDLSKLTKIKWDDKVVNVVTAIIRIWKPFFKWISKQEQNIINNMEARLKVGQQELPKVKEEGKIYQVNRKKAKELVQAQRNNKTEQPDVNQEDNDMAKRKKKKLSPEARAARARSGAKVFNTILNPLSAIPNNIGYGLARNLEKLAADRAYKKAVNETRGNNDHSQMSDQQRRKKEMWMRAHDKGSNDLSWYNNYPDLISGLITPNFMRRKGIVETARPAVAVPSVAGLELAETLGSDVNGAYTSGMLKLFTSLRMANTGATTYTKLDVERYVLNVRAAIIAIRQLRRDYALATKFSALDNDIPSNFFSASKINYAEVRDNLADIRQFLNYASEKLHVISPIKIDLLERTCWLCDNVFKDSDDAKTQFYIPYFDKVWYYNYITQNYSNQTIRATGYTVQQILTAISAMVDNLVNDPKNGLIAADILKAYGQESMAYFMVIPEDYSIEFIYSEEVLTQIQNATVLPVSVSIGNNATNDGLTEVVTHTFTGNASDASVLDTYNKVASTKFINFYKDSISPLDVMGATRLTALGTIDTSTGSAVLTFTAYGTEILENIWIYGAGALQGRVLNWAQYDDTIYLDSVTTLEEFIFRWYAWAAFDWMPATRFLSLLARNSSGTAIRYSSDLEILDYNNYSKITTVSQLQDIHNVAILSLYYVSSKIRESKVTDLAPLA